MKLGHVVFLVQDLEAMIGFYTDCLGLAVSDRGHTRGRSGGPQIVFLSFDRSVVHHQVAFVEAGAATPAPGRLHHFAFEVADLAELRRFWARLAEDPRAGGLDGPRPTAVFQGDQWSIRLRDPEGNGIEISAPTPWDVRQPLFFAGMDLALDEEALVTWARGLLEGRDFWERGARPAES